MEQKKTFWALVFVILLPKLNHFSAKHDHLIYHLGANNRTIGTILRCIYIYFVSAKCATALNSDVCSLSQAETAATLIHALFRLYLSITYLILSPSPFALLKGVCTVSTPSRNP